MERGSQEGCSRLPIRLSHFNCHTLCNCRAAISGHRCDNYTGVTYGLRQLSGVPILYVRTALGSTHTLSTTSPCLSPSMYVDLSVAVRGQLASGYIRECTGKPNCCTPYNCHNSASGHPATIIGSRLYSNQLWTLDSALSSFPPP
jgi:hypothetical protein